MNAISLFSSIGVGEFYLNEIDVNVVVANELIPSRANTYSALHPEVDMIIGDICEEDIKREIVKKAKENNVEFILATPPCQGLSRAGKNKTSGALLLDKRNFLIINAIEIAKKIYPNYILIENVPRFQEMLFPYNDRFISLEDLLSLTFGEEYEVSVDILNSADYGVPQTRNRVIYRVWKKGLIWKLPQKEHQITLKEAIGHLPSLEASENSSIKNHYARKHPANQISWMQHTPSGCSAYSNDEFYPQKADGTKIVGYKNCYTRMSWDRPAPTITMRNEIMSSQENVHPGHLLSTGIWSDARVLTPRELLIVSSLPADLDIPQTVSETTFRQLVGEGIPPLMLKKVISGINEIKKERINSMKGLSMFSGGGIAETYFSRVGIDIVVANELLPERAAFYKHCYPTTKMICGDIKNESIFKEVVESAKSLGVNFIMATPPCQGMSTLGKKQYATDVRNELFWYAIKAINELQPDYVLIENVPKFLKLLFSYEQNTLPFVDILKEVLGKTYCIESRILNAADFGVPQSRPRAIIKLYKRGLTWAWPSKKEHTITLREAIGDLPPLEPGERSELKWHSAVGYSTAQAEALRHTPEGCSALNNPIYFPKKKNGERIRGFHNTYKRMKWDEPAPARTTNSFLVSGHNNVHPGRLLPTGLWSDPRALTLRELIVVSSLPLDWNIPESIKEPFVRELIGEAIPPLLSKSIVETILNGGENLLYDRSSTREKWTIMMYMRSFELMATYAYALRASNELTKDNIDEILNQMELDGIYRPRNGGSTFTGTFKTIQIAWYMFGYYDNSRRKGKTKKLVFSPLGNLLLDNLKDDEKVKRIFLTMLFANAFRQPFSQMDHRFNIYAFRLIFQLLRDSRLEGRLYHDEVFYLAMFIKQIDPEKYELLVNDIISLRAMDSFAKFKLFKKNERTVGLACHEWRYAAGMMESAGIITVHNDHQHRSIGKLTYGNGTANRTYYEDYIQLVPDLMEYTDTLLSSYSCFELPYFEGESEEELSSETLVRLYSFYPPELLEELRMDTDEDKAISDMLNIAIDIKTYSHTDTKTGAKFEYALEKAFNLFIDIEAERIGGAGNADIECRFAANMERRYAKKFDVEAKSTATKLLQIVPKRLKIHRDRINSQYTIVVAPNFARGVLSDIKGENIVIIKAATLANYLYQYISKNGRNISYLTLDKIICCHRGEDITDIVNDYVYSNFGHGYTDLRIKS